MKDKQELIRSIIGLQDKFSRLSLADRVENWMNLDLTIDQLKSLILIQNHGKVSFTDLAQALGSTRGNITGIARRLMQNGLVIRQYNPDDRRVQYLVLTEKAQEILNNIKQMINTKVVNILSGLNLEDLAALEKGITAFINSAEVYILSGQNPISVIKEPRSRSSSDHFKV
jgi:DNA-binding MarR family transcriptional regulator